MPYLFVVVAFLCLSVTSASCQSTSNPVEPEPVEQGEYQLVWSDEFEMEGLPDATKWGYDVGGHGWGNQELQFYTSGRSENARVEGGSLIIEAHKEDWGDSEYTSARLVSKNKGDWTYGRFEVRAKLPSGRGTWPAIWMLPTQWTYGDGSWPDNGEIDIMEHVGYEPDIVHATVHTRAYHHSIGTQKSGQLEVPTARSDFNVYAVEWERDEIRAYINDVHYFTFKNERLTNSSAGYRQWPFDKAFHFVLNIAVGGTWGGVQGVDPSIWPQKMEVDYVKVYQRQP